MRTSSLIIYHLLIGLLLTPGIASAQEVDLWPSNSFSISDDDPDKREFIEYYDDHNVFARGPLAKSGEITVIDAFKNMQEVKKTVYVRSGAWTIYYDSGISVVRSQGTFVEGKRHGQWKVFDRYGNLRREYVFAHDVIKQQTEVNAAGNRSVVVDRSSMGVLFMRYHTAILIFALLPICLFRIGCNILVWNRIYGTRYIPGFHEYQKGGWAVGMYATVNFWWIRTNEDSVTVTKYKRVANWICVLSVIIFLLFTWAESEYA